MPQARPVAMIDPAEVPPIRSKSSQGNTSSPRRRLTRVSTVFRNFSGEYPSDAATVEGENALRALGGIQMVLFRETHAHPPPQGLRIFRLSEQKTTRRQILS